MMNPSKRIKQIHSILKAGKDISDESLIKAADKYSVMTNTLEAARLLMWAFAPFCAYRPHLTKQFLSRILIPLWMTDFEVENVLSWLQFYLDKEQPFDLTDSFVIEWIKTLQERDNLIQQLLIKVECFLDTRITRQISIY